MPSQYVVVSFMKPSAVVQWWPGSVLANAEASSSVDSSRLSMSRRLAGLASQALDAARRGSWGSPVGVLDHQPISAVRVKARGSSSLHPVEMLAVNMLAVSRVSDAWVWLAWHSAGAHAHGS